MKDTLFNRVYKGRIIIIIIIISVIISSCTFIYMGRELNKITELNKKFECYINLIQEYDTTSNYNKIILYPKIMELSDSIKNIK